MPHQLNTVIDYDKVIVMDKGKVAEFEAPRDLLEDETGMLTDMVNATCPKSQVCRTTKANGHMEIGVHTTSFKWRWRSIHAL